MTNQKEANEGVVAGWAVGVEGNENKGNDMPEVVLEWRRLASSPPAIAEEKASYELHGTPIYIYIYMYVITRIG